MRLLLLPLLALSLFCSSTLLAQSDKGGVSFKRLFMDYQTLNGGDFSAFKDYTDGLEFSYFHPLRDRLWVNVPVKIGLATRDSEGVKNSIFGLDGQLNYHFRDSAKVLRPYGLAGVGFAIENGDSANVQFPLGLGLDIRIAPNAYFNWQSEIRPSTSEDKSNFHHGIGFKYYFGGKGKEMVEVKEVLDSDGDGIEDALDLCPQVAGIAAFSGCPDTDNDGIPDSKDECPEYPGLEEFQGCPDSDSDGVSDNEDECPNVAGPASNRGCPVTDRDGDGVSDDQDACPDERGLPALNGCPDRDDDGIADKDDQCPNRPGPAMFQGCPDTDADGIPDPADRCPNSAGPANNEGCPVIEVEDRKTLDLAMQSVQFEHGRATLRSQSFRILNQIAEILGRYPDHRLEISGHTDNTGASALNQKLSEARAKACYDYLATRGISLSKMSYIGFGEARPIADNNTLSGRQLNRRVEFQLFPAR